MVSLVYKPPNWSILSQFYLQKLFQMLWKNPKIIFLFSIKTSLFNKKWFTYGNFYGILGPFTMVRPTLFDTYWINLGVPPYFGCNLIKNNVSQG